MKKIVFLFLILPQCFLHAMEAPTKTIMQQSIEEHVNQLKAHRDVERVLKFLTIEDNPLAKVMRMQEILEVGIRIIFLSDLYTTQEKLQFLQKMEESWQKHRAFLLNQEKELEQYGIFRAFKFIMIDPVLLGLRQLLEMAYHDNNQSFTFYHPVIRATASLPLHIAVEQGFEPLIYLLINLGADIGSRNNKGETIWHLAAGGHRVDLLRLFYQLYADQPFMLIDLAGNTPLHTAVMNKAVSVINFMLALPNKHDFIDLQNQHKETPLSLAVQAGDAEIVQLLLGNNVDPNVQDDEGDTPLHKAIKHKHKKIVYMLLQSEYIDPLISNKKNQLPHDVASLPEYFDVDIINLLQPYCRRSSF